jgi:copper ion binding protein
MGLFGKSKTVELDVDGMTCGHCVMRVEKALKGVKGVKDVKVDLKARTATVKAEGDVQEKDLVDAVDKAGYKAKMALNV